ncbi:hypothetical protein [Gottfriedia solisilvae]|uniref:hypothetical protein n=1 Tax=Gottfriedia solisilvae TaxID=1516104 RepID=UPI003D2F2860
MGDIGFILLGFIVWGLISFGLILLLWGLWKKSWKSFLWSGIALLPTLFYIGGENWERLIALTPLIPFALAFYTKSAKIK